MVLAQATAGERGVFVAQTFFAVLAIAGIAVGAFFLFYLLAAPALTAAGTPGTQRLRRILTGYLFVGPLVLINLILVFWLFVGQYFAVNWLYGSVANPNKVFEAALASAGMPSTGQSPAVQILEALKSSAGFGSSGYYKPISGFTKFVWWCYGVFNWAILGSVLFAMLRDLALTSWTLLSAPVRREIHGQPWWDLAKGALFRFLHVFFYSLFVGVVFVVMALGILFLSYLGLRMVAGLAVTYVKTISVSGGGLLPAVLLGSFYGLMLEVLLGLFFSTVLLSFIASRCISLNLEDLLTGILGLPRPTSPPPKLWPAMKSAALLLSKMVVAILPSWLLMGFVIGRFFPLALSAPAGVVMHLGVFNLVLFLLKAHKDVVPLAVEAWRGRPWAVFTPDVKEAPGPTTAAVEGAK